MPVFPDLADNGLFVVRTTKDLQVVPGGVQSGHDLGPLGVELLKVGDDLVDLVFYVPPTTLEVGLDRIVVRLLQ